MDLPTLGWMVLLTAAMGPAGSVPFALGRGWTPWETALAVAVIHSAQVPFLFSLFELLRYGRRYEDRLVSSLLKLAEKKSKGLRREAASRIAEFERRVGQLGFGLGVVGFSFLFGNFWASLGAYVLNLRKVTIMVAITVGAVASSFFWTLAFVGVVGFLPNPWVWYLVLMGATLTLLFYKKLRERRLGAKFLRLLTKGL